MSILSAISGFAFLNGHLLAVWLWRHRDNQPANRWLSALIASVSLLYIDAFTYNLPNAIQKPQITFLFLWLIFLLGPLCFQYVRILTSTTRFSLTQWIWHGLPSIIALVILYFGFHRQPYGIRYHMLKIDMTDNPDVSLFDVLNAVAVPHIAIYVGASIVLLRRYRKRLKESSGLHTLRLGWLTKLLCAIVVLVLIDALASATPWVFAEWLRIIVPALGIYALGYLGLVQPQIFILSAGSSSTKSSYLCSCFVSHSTKDRVFVSRFCADLKQNGVDSWVAPENLEIGAKLRSALFEAIRQQDRVIVVISKNSIKSPRVEDEVEITFEWEREKEKLILFPVRLDDAASEVAHGWPADIRRTRHIGDFCDWRNPESYKKAFDAVLRYLKPKETTHSAFTI